MPLYYCKMPEGNVGDDLNEIIWPNYLDVNAIADDHEVVGIGSLLNHFMPQANNYTILSAGVGYGPLPNSYPEWDIIALRGTLSAKKLGVAHKKDIVLLDGAYLLLDCYPLPALRSENKIGYVPHVASLKFGDWQAVCDKANLTLIDPRLPLDEFLLALSQCDKVLCEAMHGAILADIMRIPWQPVKAYAHINTHKWDDWLSAFNTRATFSAIKGVWYQHDLHGLDRLKNSIKKCIFLFTDTDKITPPIYNESTAREVNNTSQQLIALKDKAFYLNDVEQINEKVAALKTALAKLSFSLSHSCAEEAVS